MGVHSLVALDGEQFVVEAQAGAEFHGHSSDPAWPAGGVVRAEGAPGLASVTSVTVEMSADTDPAMLILRECRPVLSRKARP